MFMKFNHFSSPFIFMVNLSAGWHLSASHAPEEHRESMYVLTFVRA